MQRRLICFILASLSTGAFAQAAAIYQNFRHLPAGQYTQTLTAEFNGRSMPPQRQTHCTAGTPDTRMIAAANQMATVSGCSTRVLVDTERLAESEQTCRTGSATQTVHSTMRLVDDRTFAVDTVMKLAGSPVTSSHSVVVYEGACTASAKAASEPSASDCADLRASLSDSSDGVTLCAQAPAEMRAQCQARVEAGRKMAEMATARCR